MDPADLFFPAYRKNPVYRFFIQIAKASGINDFQRSEASGNLCQLGLVEPKVGLFILREIQMIITETASSPLAAAAS